MKTKGPEKILIDALREFANPSRWTAGSCFIEPTEHGSRCWSEIGIELATKAIQDYLDAKDKKMPQKYEYMFVKTNTSEIYWKLDHLAPEQGEEVISIAIDPPDVYLLIKQLKIEEEE